MIAITGDLHRNYDIEKLAKIAELPDYPSIVLVAGDFGGIWNKTTIDIHGNVVLHPDDLDFIDSLKRYPFKIISCLGNHENYDVINNLPRIDAYGGRIIRLSDNVELLDRGYVYNLEDYSFLSIGGAMSMDRAYRIEHESYWENEVINKNDIDVAFNELDKVDNNVDFVLTHTCPSSVLKSEIDSLNEPDSNYKMKLRFALENDPSVIFLEEIKNKIQYSHWFFGHFHMDKIFNHKGSSKFMCLYNTWKKLCKE